MSTTPAKPAKQRRTDDEFKPPSAKKSKQATPKTEAEHTSVQRIRLLDLIKYNYLSAGEEVFVKEQDGIITDRGTIKVLTGSGYIEYSNPTSWTKQVTGRENGGWGQIRLKSSKQTLASIKEQYQKSMSTLDYIEDPDTSKPIAYPTDPTLNSSPTAAPVETAPSDLTLPLKVRFINDEDRVFKIIWVSSDFKEFHTEYQGNLYSNLADFVTKIFEDFQKPSLDPNAPPPGNLRFDELMYELSPGKWVKLAGNLFPSELMPPQGNQPNNDQVTYQQGLLGSQTHLQQPPHNFSNSTPTGDNCNHRINIPHSNCNNNINTGVDASNLNDSTHTNNNTSYDEFSVADEDNAEDDDEFQDPRRRRSSLNKSRSQTGKRPSPPCYKCLVYVDDSEFPVRVTNFAPTTVQNILHTAFNETHLKHNNASEADLLRDYNIEIEDQDFGGIKVVFPRSIASFPTKCKLFIRRKEQMDATLDQTGDKQDEVHIQPIGDDKNGIFLDKEMEKEPGDILGDKSQSSEKEEGDE